jgi:hypothetical protein
MSSAKSRMRLSQSVAVGVALIVYGFNVNDFLCIPNHSRPYISSRLKHFKFLAVGEFKSSTYFTVIQTHTIITNKIK